MLIPLLAAAGPGFPTLQQEWPRAARELAAKILAITGPVERIHISVHGGEGPEGESVVAAQRELEKDFQRRGIGLVPEAEGAVAVALTVSENLQGLVWIAEIRRGDYRDAAMVSLPSPAPGGERNPPSVIIQLRPVFQQKRPILDLIRLENELIVLDPQNISLYKRSEGWEFLRAVALPHPPDSPPLPRDPRGRLMLHGPALEVYFAGGHLTLQADLSGMAEVSSSAGWPWEARNSELVAGRNYFRAEGLPPFYSMARFGSQTDLRRLVAGLDGKTSLYGPDGEVITAFAGWGSDITALSPACGEGFQVLAVIPGENDLPDSIQVYRITDRRAVAMSSPTRLPGTVTALWSASGERAAMLVCHNPTAKRYEAFEASVICSR